jgi:hypothetical protein
LSSEIIHKGIWACAVKPWRHTLFALLDELDIDDFKNGAIFVSKNMDKPYDAVAFATHFRKQMVTFQPNFEPYEEGKPREIYADKDNHVRDWNTFIMTPPPLNDIVFAVKDACTNYYNYQSLVL